ncbi:MAG: sulfatase-like hydrolase/transferase, partial [Parvularculaceae bacterium]
VEDGEYLTRLPKNYYSTRTYTDKIIDYIDSTPEGAPFFAYLAYQAPHDPIQAPEGWLRRYKGAYDAGWDAIRDARIARMKEMGVMPASTNMAPRLWYIPEWDKLTGVAQVQQARRMEIYASVVEYLDLQVGRLIDHLEETGELDNTVIIFFSDNGPNPHDPIEDAKRGAGKVNAANFYPNNYETDFASWGRPNAWLSQGTAWAQVSATPLNGFKLTSFDGGVRSPLIVWRGGDNTGGAVDTADIMHVSDVAPTMLDLAGIPQASLYPAQAAALQTGRSWVPLLSETNALSARGVGMEIFGGRAYREGRWKVTWMHEPFGADDWQLFDIETDPSESKDVSAAHPNIKARLVAAWNAYAKANNVIVPDRTEFDGLEDKLPPRPDIDAPDWPRGGEPNWTQSTRKTDNE